MTVPTIMTNVTLPIRQISGKIAVILELRHRQAQFSPMN